MYIKRYSFTNKYDANSRIYKAYTYKHMQYTYVYIYTADLIL